MDDTFSASDFSSAETSLSSNAPAASEPAASSAPVQTTAQPEGATTPPAAVQTVSPSTEPAKPAGPIPFDVHKTALENARIKANAEWDQQYGWAKQVDPQQFQQIQQIARHFMPGNDPIQGLQALIGEIRKDPQYDAQLKSLAARALAQRSTPAADQEPSLQTIPVQLENGQVVHLPTADSVSARETWLQRQAVTQAMAQFQPHVQMLQTLQQREQTAQRQHQIDTFVSTTHRDLMTWPGMDTPANQQAIAQALQRMQVDPHDPREVALALDKAYRSVVLPTLHTASRQAVLNDINRQAAASTVNPARTSTRAAKTMDDMSIAEALQFVATQSA